MFGGEAWLALTRPGAFLKHPTTHIFPRQFAIAFTHSFDRIGLLLVLSYFISLSS
jgi:hypothetical protein